MRKLINKGLDAAESEDEQTLYIQFIRNSAQPEFIPKLLKYAESSKYPLVNHLAITTLSVFDSDQLPSNARVVLNRIYHQNNQQYESTVRSAAANMILSSIPSALDVENIVLSLPQLKSRELANFIHARIMDLIKTDHPSK